MQKSAEREISVAFQRLSITPETRKHGNEIKELTTPFQHKIFTTIEILLKEKKRSDTKSIFEYLCKKSETLKNDKE